MNVRGVVRKMAVALGEDGVVSYAPPFEGVSGPMNDLIGSPVTLRFTGSMYCTRCGRRTNKLFGEGFCYPCFRDAPEASECIVRPELCEAHLGGGRDPEWEAEHHNQPHAVYLAVTNAVKVGVTRQTQIPTRWIDQGAAYAAQIAAVPYRRLAGEIEVALKTLFTDRTNWQRMLKDESAGDVDLATELTKCEALLPGALSQYLIGKDELTVVSISYPVENPPPKVSSINLGKTGEFAGLLSGIRGQYLIFADNHVLNVRRHSGMEIEISICPSEDK